MANPFLQAVGIKETTPSVSSNSNPFLEALKKPTTQQIVVQPTKPTGFWGKIGQGIDYIGDKIFKGTPLEIKKPQPKINIGDLATKYTPGTLQTLSELQVDPLTLKANPTKAVNDYWNSVKDQMQGAGEAIANVIEGRTTSEKMGAGLQVVPRVIGTLISPITAIFSAANDIPVLGSVSKLISIPFQFGGEEMGAVGKQVVQRMVENKIISPDVGSKIEDGVSEIFSLAAQFAIGGGAEKASTGGKFFDGLKTKYGERDAVTIIDTAKKMAEEKRANGNLLADVTKGQNIGIDLRPKQEGGLMQDIIPKNPFMEAVGIKEPVKKVGGVPEAPKELQPLAEEAKIIREATGLSADQIMKQHPDINLKRDVPITDIHGVKKVIPEGEALTPYELKGNKVVLQDGETYVVSKNQFQNIKGNAVSSEVKEFAPELKGTEETVKGGAIQEEIKRMPGESEADYNDRLDLESGLIPKETTDSLTKFSQYQLPGGKNYKEVLIKAPTNKKVTHGSDKYILDKLAVEYRGQKFDQLEPTARNQIREIFNKKGEGLKYNEPIFKSSHWDEPNVISHLRLNERTYQGKKVTFMEELQSDWAREARKQGQIVKMTPETIPDGWRFKESPSAGGYYISNENGEVQGFGKTKQEALNQINQRNNPKLKDIPDNPLLKNWQELSVKRALQEAVNNKSEYFSWTNGEQQAARYNLSKEIDNISWARTDETSGNKRVMMRAKDHSSDFDLTIDKNGNVLKGNESKFNGKNISEIIGKGIGEKIVAEGKGGLAGEGLNIGGEWAKNLYDKQVKNIVEDLTGGKVEMIDMGLPVRDKAPQFVARQKSGIVDVTPENLRVGVEIMEDNGGRDMVTLNQSKKYIITDILGDGKFKAVPKEVWDSRTSIVSIKKQQIERAKETFDISAKKTVQQAIKITPEIRALVKGEAMPLKKPSGVMPLTKPVEKPIVIKKPIKKSIEKPPITNEETASMVKLDQLKEELRGVEYAIEDNPALALTKYATNRKRELPEVIGATKTASGKKVGIYGKTGDQIVQEMGFRDFWDAEKAYDDLVRLRDQRTRLKEQIAAEKKNLSASRMEAFNILENQKSLDRSLELEQRIEESLANTKGYINNKTTTEGNKVSGVAENIEARAIEDKLTKGYEDKANFPSSSFRIESQKVADLINSGIDNARAIVRGEVPTDIKSGALIAGMEEYAKQYPEMAGEIMQELANSPLASTISRGASETSFARMREPDSATAKLQEVKKVRENKVRDLPAKKTKAIKELKLEGATDEKFNLSKEERSFNNFLDKIIC